MSEKGFMNENNNDWFGYLTSADYQPFSHHKKKQKKEFCCELFQIEFEHGSFSKEVREGKTYYTMYLFDNKNREGGSMPDVTPISFCPHCGMELSE